MAQLLAIVGVPQENRVTCQATGCGHAVWKRIHIVKDEGATTFVGSDCFARLYRDIESTPPLIGREGEARELSEYDRDLMVQNTAAFVQWLEENQRMLEQLEAEEAELEAEKARTFARQNGATRVGWEGPEGSESYGPREPPVKWVDIEGAFGADEIARATAKAKQALRERFSIDPNLPGWIGLWRQEAIDLLLGRSRGTAEAARAGGEQQSMW